MKFQIQIIDKWLVGASFLILLLSPLFLFLDEQMQLILCLSMLLITGIPHGALDHIVFFKLVSPQSKKINFHTITRFVIIYMLSFLGFLLLWVISPMLTLIIFLLISAYHFGESQLFYVSSKTSPPGSLYFLWGSFLLSMYIAIHEVYAFELLNSVMSYHIHLESMYIQMISMGLGFCWLLQMLFLLWQQKITFSILFNELLVIGVIALLFLCLPPLFSFMVYFGLWHALKVFYAEYILLRRSSQVSNLRQIIMASLPFSVIAIVGLILFVLGNNYFQLGVNPIMMIIIGISAMTLPHAAIMQQMYKRYLSN